MIRVVLCTDGVFPEAMGGMQRHSRLLAEHLARTGAVDLTVIHPHAPGLFDPVLGIHEVCIPNIDTDKFYLRELWRYSGRVAEELDRLEADVILSQGFSVWKDAQRFSDRLIVHPHGLEMYQGLTARERLMGIPFRIVLRRIVRRARVVVSLGGRLTTILDGITNGSRCTVVTLPNAVDVPTDPTVYVPSSPLRFLFVGRFAFNKGLDVLMTVARRLAAEGRSSEYHFDLAGAGPLLASYQAMGLPDNVSLLGRVEDDRLFQLYSGCDAFLLPTRFEGMPTVVLEAMGRSRPVMVSDVGATAELVDASNGYLLRKGDAEDLYARIREFGSRSPEQRAEMGRSSWQKARERFDWTVVTPGFVRLFKDIAGNK
ncbi:MAG: glycosyltransferase family 4 protein [Flavobacteriales bacterium]|nr:glycosyltransferase family 4 protein [Flavobacteriales bacterium]